MIEVVEHRITDGTRIAQLLASEVDGRTDSGLDAVTVTNADRAVEPSPDGARAYDIVLPSEELLGQVFVHPNKARLSLESSVVADTNAVSEAAEMRDLAYEVDTQSLWIDDGAAVKRASDIVTDLVSLS